MIQRDQIFQTTGPRLPPAAADTASVACFVVIVATNGSEAEQQWAAWVVIQLSSTGTQLGWHACVASEWSAVEMARFRSVRGGCNRPSCTRATPSGLHRRSV
jgi:hypothetical protein